MVLPPPLVGDAVCIAGATGKVGILVVQFGECNLCRGGFRTRSLPLLQFFKLLLVIGVLRHRSGGHPNHCVEEIIVSPVAGHKPSPLRTVGPGNAFEFRIIPLI